MKAEVAVIGGVAIDLGGEENLIETPHGTVKVKISNMAGKKVAFIPRHGEGHLPPHKANYRALVSAAKLTGASRIISTNTVGAMSWHPIGSFLIANDFVEFTKSRICTFYENRAVHVDLSQPYCPQIQAALKEGVRKAGMEPQEGVYVCTEGPHLESPAQIKMIRKFGDVVGMTGYPEVVLARELELCYASICIVTNPATGMRRGEAMTASEIVKVMKSSMEKLLEVISIAISEIPLERNCACGKALDEAKL